jgi:class 3 adenylate cyclase
MLYAATYPRQVSGLVLINAYARYVRNDECPWGLPADGLSDYVAGLERMWGTPALGEILAPTLCQNEDANLRLARAERLTASPDTIAAITGAFWASDVTGVLAAIQAPTLVISRRGDRHVRPEHSRYLAKNIAAARLVELAGEDHLFFSGNADEVLDEVEEFLTGMRAAPLLNRVLTTVMFVDIVGSTRHATAVGDRRWRESLDQFYELVDRHLARYRGHRVNTTGDGVVASFDGPARAVECARSIAKAVRGLGIESRAGLHTGEVEIRGNDLAGVAVHIAARVIDIAGPGEILVSRTVTDLVAGSGIEFADSGEHELKGVPGQWQLFAVRDVQPDRHATNAVE